MDRGEIESELKDITDNLSDEDLYELLIFAKGLKINLLVEKPGDFERFYTLISSINKRPGMYDIQNIEDLYLFIGAIGLTSGLTEIANDFSHEFKNYVNKNYSEDFKSRKMDIGWARLIRFYSSGDRHTLELFSRWFDAFVDSYKKELSEKPE